VGKDPSILPLLSSKTCYFGQVNSSPAASHDSFNDLNIWGYVT